jgi:phage shock protein E
MNFPDIDFESATFIDVRSEAEYLDENIKGSINIPLDELFHKIKEVESMKKPLIFYCRSGSRSQIAVDILKSQGFEQVYNGGGISNLIKLLD